MIYIPPPRITNAIIPTIIYIIILLLEPVGGVILIVILSSSCSCKPTSSNDISVFIVGKKEHIWIN